MEPVPDKCSLPMEPVPDKCSMPMEPVPDKCSMPMEPVPDKCSMPMEPVPDKCSMPMEPVPDKCSVPKEPVPDKCSLPIEPVPDKCSLPIEQFEENYVPYKCSFNFGKKKKKALGQHSGMLSDGVILLHDNTHTARKTQELLQKFKWNSDATPHTTQIWHPIWVPNTYLEQGSLHTVMSKQLPRTGSMGRDVISTKPG
ncbi:hypothetical protein AVEN_87129-1 [Araneus ventricosus]|uniref:Uncharacterized protein n=1 Tax=Araneus ventricosus TaxID=182803 RepID=A0A4Y2PS98_ARAVE|nr:hypothetical protein AVEN_87129-1 [Araneus ventricosus]